MAQMTAVQISRVGAAFEVVTVPSEAMSEASRGEMFLMPKLAYRRIWRTAVPTRTFKERWMKVWLVAFTLGVVSVGLAAEIDLRAQLSIKQWLALPTEAQRAYVAGLLDSDVLFKDVDGQPVAVLPEERLHEPTRLVGDLTTFWADPAHRNRPVRDAIGIILGSRRAIERLSR